MRRRVREIEWRTETVRRSESRISKRDGNKDKRVQKKREGEIKKCDGRRKGGSGRGEKEDERRRRRMRKRRRELRDRKMVGIELRTTQTK